VGSHAIAALARARHRIRVLARSADRVHGALEPLGVDRVETVTGDVTDPVAVERALEGTDAVLHAAAVFSMDPRKADEMRSVNVRGTDVVLGTAHRLGLDPIVFVSSELALLPPADGQVLTPESPVKQTSWPYCRSKADSELVARRYQEQGAPVVSVMPAAVWGPHDPRFGEGVTRATNVLKHRYPIVMPGGMHIADVRDVAAVLAAVMTPGRGPRSYMVAGHYIPMPALIRTLADLTGRRIRFATFPPWFLAAFGRTADLVQRRVSTRLPWDAEGICGNQHSVDCAATPASAQSGGGPGPSVLKLPMRAVGVSRGCRRVRLGSRRRCTSIAHVGSPGVDDRERMDRAGAIRRRRSTSNEPGRPTVPNPPPVE
jgi:nucleoside-diphosphate-sugar epimerase